jgi:uncharacterized protein RhaS with RHS repeats
MASESGRTTTLTLASDDLVNITNPDGGVRTFTYDGNHLLTRDQYGPNLESNYQYTGFGTVGTITQERSPWVASATRRGLR